MQSLNVGKTLVGAMDEVMADLVLKERCFVTSCALVNLCQRVLPAQPAFVRVRSLVESAFGDGAWLRQGDKLEV